MNHVPLKYAAKCKRNRSNGLPFVADNVFDDLLTILFAFALISPAPLSVAISIISLHYSMWMIYEVGYFDNDLVSKKKEAEPKVPDRFEKFAGNFSEKSAWIWAASIGFFGCSLVVTSGVHHLAPLIGTEASAGGHKGIGAAVFLLAIWMMFLLMLRGAYHLYNRIDKKTRVLFYVVLQAMKYAFPAIFFYLPAAGAALVASHILRRWIPYVVYRYGYRQPKNLSARLLRLSFFLLFWSLLLPSNFTYEHAVLGIAMLALLALKSIGQVRDTLARAKGIAEDDWSVQG